MCNSDVDEFGLMKQYNIVLYEVIACCINVDFMTVHPSSALWSCGQRIWQVFVRQNS